MIHTPAAYSLTMPLHTAEHAAGEWQSGFMTSQYIVARLTTSASVAFVKSFGSSIATSVSQMVQLRDSWARSAMSGFAWFKFSYKAGRASDSWWGKASPSGAGSGFDAPAAGTPT